MSYFLCTNAWFKSKCQKKNLTYMEHTPKAFLKKSNCFESRAFVKISTSCFYVLMYSKDTVLLSTKFLMKW